MTKDQKLLNDIKQMTIGEKETDSGWVKDEVPKEMSVKKLTPETKKGLEMIDGNYTLNSMGEQLAYAQYLMDNLLVSDSFKKASQLVIAIQTIKEFGLPSSSLKDFYVLKGKVAIFGDTYLGLMHSSGYLEEFQVTFFDEVGNLIERPKKGQVFFGCEIYAKRKGHDCGSRISFTMDDKTLSGTTNETWNKHPRDMLFRRCAGRVAKWLTPDAIRGLYFGDEMEDYNDKTSDKEAASLATQVFSS